MEAESADIERARPRLSDPRQYSREAALTVALVVCAEKPVL